MSDLRTRLENSLTPLGCRSFLLLWMGQTISSAGTSLGLIGFVFAILRLGGTAADVGFVFAIQATVGVASLLAGGVWADRLPRQVVMLVCEAIQSVVRAALVVLLITGKAHVWELGVAAAISGLADSFFSPAVTALTAETVQADQLLRANGLLSSSANLVRLGGLAIGGVLVAVFGPAIALAIDGTTFAADALLLARLRLKHREMPEAGSFLHDLAAGWREVAIRPWYWLSLIAQALGNFGFCAYFVLGPVIAAHTLGGATAWGVLASAQAAGATLGGALAIRFTPARPLIAGNLAAILAMLPLLALAPPLTIWAVAISSGLGGAGLTYLTALFASTMQSLVPPDVQARVDAYDWLISLAVMPAGFALAGPVAMHIGDTAALVGGATLIGLPCALLVLVPDIRRVRTGADGRITGPSARERGVAALRGAGKRDRRHAADS